jgi:hypothetical protein
MFHSCERIHSKISEKLTFAQYQRWTNCPDRNYLARFRSLNKVTKSKALLALANEGVKAYHIEIRKTFKLVG